MKNDLISRADLLAKVRKIRRCNDCSGKAAPFEGVSVEDVKAANGLKLVYCRECRYWRVGNGDSWCIYGFGLKGCADPYDYCSNGEKGSRQLRQTEGNDQVETED